MRLRDIEGCRKKNEAKGQVEDEQYFAIRDGAVEHFSLLACVG